MYDNIGQKIKTLAKASFVVEAIGGVITGIVFLSDDEVATGLIIILCSILVAWVSSWCLYGYGQLIENSDIIAAQYKRQEEKHNKTVAKNEQIKKVRIQQEAQTRISDANVSDDEFIDLICPACKEKLSFTKSHILENKNLTCPLCNTKINIK